MIQYAILLANAPFQAAGEAGGQFVLMISEQKDS